MSIDWNACFRIYIFSVDRNNAVARTAESVREQVLTGGATVEHGDRLELDGVQQQQARLVAEVAVHQPLVVLDEASLTRDRHTLQTHTSRS